jgi:hypothetical protein
MNLYMNDKLVCNSQAVYGGKGGVLVEDGKTWETISRMEECQKPIKVKKNDLLKMVAVYDIEKHPLRAQATGERAEEMGIMTFSFVPDKDA